jgi:hypothetical protein
VLALTQSDIIFKIQNKKASIKVKKKGKKNEDLISVAMTNAKSFIVMIIACISYAIYFIYLK